MKKFFITALVALTAVICISAAKASNPEYQSNSNATVEYVIPGITSGSMKLQHFHMIFDLLPYDIQKMSVEAFRDIVDSSRSEFVYGGVKVKHYGNTWEFHYSGSSVVVKDASLSELTQIFTMPAVI